MGEDRIQWHPAFAKALELELKDYCPDVFSIETEHNLTSKPLAIDILIIKKIRDTIVAKNIAQIFKGYNIVEYKSPRDKVSIDDFYKVKAYAYLYKVLEGGIDKIKIDDMTITIVCSAFPRKMSEHITKAHKAIIANHSQGIYYVENIDIQTQIIVIDELPKLENRYVRLLAARANIKDEITLFFNDMVINPKDESYELLLEILLKYNQRQFLEVFEMSIALTAEQEMAFKKVADKFNFTKTWFEDARLEGEVRGEIKEGRALVFKLLNKKLGQVSEELTAKLQSIEDIKVIDLIVDKIFEINSASDVLEILGEYAAK